MPCNHCCYLSLIHPRVIISFQLPPVGVGYCFGIQILVDDKYYFKQSHFEIFKGIIKLIVRAE